METKKQYETLAKKFNLPDFELIDRYFEIESLEESKFLLREIRRKISDKLESFSKILEEVLQPEAQMASLIECRAFNDNDKKEILDLYRKVMYLHRQSMSSALKTDDKADAQFITETFKDWENLKGSMLKIVDKLKECWQEELSSEEKANYFG